MSDVGIRNELKNYVSDNATDDVIVLPRWAVFVMCASRLIPRPAFLIPYLISVLGWSVVTHSAGASLIFPAGILAVIWLSIVTLHSAGQMRAYGILEGYVALLTSETSVGRWIVARVSRVQRAIVTK